MACAKMRWNCDVSGCFNERHRLTFAPLNEALSGNRQFTDIDAMTEAHGNCLLIEWKSPGATIPPGQHYTFMNLTPGRRVTVFYVQGDSSSMQPETVCQYVDGKLSGPRETSLADLQNSIASWEAWSRANPCRWRRP